MDSHLEDHLDDVLRKAKEYRREKEELQRILAKVRRVDLVDATNISISVDQKLTARLTDAAIVCVKESIMTAEQKYSTLKIKEVADDSGE